MLCVKPADARHHVLFIAYCYPPSLEAGAKRAAGFHRFLPEWGYRSTLITIEPSTTDETIEKDVIRVQPAGYRRNLARIASGTPSAPTRLLGRLYKEVADIPDGYGSFFTPACAAAVETARRDPVSAIVATSSPYTSLRIGCALSRRLGVPWIADLRDLWTGYHFGYPHGRIRRLIDKWLERRWLATARHVITATAGFSAELEREGLFLPTSTIYNGFLEQPAYHPPSPGPFRILFLGRLYEGVDHTPQPFFEALSLLRRDSARLFEGIQVEFFGTANKEFWNLRSQFGLGETVKHGGQVSAARAREEACGADLLLVLLPDNPGQRAVIPTKVFDYAATRRPVMFVGPEGECADLIREAQLGRAFRLRDVRPIAEWLGELAAEKKMGTTTLWGDTQKVAGFHYRCRAKDLAHELDVAIGEPDGR